MLEQKKQFRRQPTLFLVLAVLIALLQATAIGATHQEIPNTLEAGQVIERQLNGGETHVFQVSLTEGQYLCIAVEQQGIDVELKLASPNKQMLIETDALNSTQGSEIAAIIAAQAGLHRIEIVAPSKNSPAGAYQVKILALRPATEQDRLWVTAQRFYLEGKQLSERSTAGTQEQIIQKFADALRIWQVLEDRLMIVHTLYYLVEVYRDLGQTQHALVYSAYALELLRALKQPREEAAALTTLAIVFSELGELRKAREFYEQSLTRWRFFNDIYGEARTLINLGAASMQLGETRVALNDFNQALAVWQKLGNRFQAAETLTFIGLAYDNLEEWQKSLEHATQALTLYRAIENKRGEALALNNLGLVYGKLGEARKALDYCNQALMLWRTLGNRREEANTLSNIGFAEAQQNNLAKALSAYQQSLPLWRLAGDHRGEARTLQRLGELQAQLAESKKALEYYEQALPLLRTAGDRLREGEVLNGLGQVFISQGAAAKAKEQFNLALVILQKIGNRAGEAQSLFGLAQAERELGSLPESRRLIETALAKVEAVRADVGSQQFRTSYLATVQRLYEFHVDLLMRMHQAQPGQGFDALALQASERARARSLLEQLVESRADIRQGVDAALLTREREVIQLLNAKAQRQSQLSQRTGDKQWQDLQQEIRQLEDEYQQVQAKVRQTSPRYAALTQPQPLGLTGLQSLLDADTLLLEYALGEERSYLWAVSADSITSYELPKRSQIEEAAKRLGTLLNARAVRQRGETVTLRAERIAQADAQLPEAAKQLSEWLLAAAAAKLANRRLLIVPDGALQYVPFAMLPEPSMASSLLPATKKTTTDGGQRTTDNQPLIVEHEIVTLPSASTLAVMRKEMAGRTPAPKQLAIFADPVFGGEDDRLKPKTASTSARKATGAKAAPALSAEVIASARSIVHEEKDAKSATGSRLQIPRLPFTRQEADRILAIASSASNSGLAEANLKALDFNANRALATGAELGQYRYLHFATHGLLDTERADFSALVLSLVDEQGKPQDGFLRVNEIYNLNLPAELVVLSACQTGLGKEYKGEGLVGLTRGFMYAGAARVVVSLWNVNDKATADLMAKFYQRMLKDGQRPAEALRSAQVEMWRQKQWQAPYYWAAFALQGEWK